MSKQKEKSTRGWDIGLEEQLLRGEDCYHTGGEIERRKSVLRLRFGLRCLPIDL